MCHANSHLRLSLHYNCRFLSTILCNICFITRTFLDNHRSITISTLRNTGIVGTARLINICKVRVEFYSTEEGIVWPEGPRPPSRDYTPLYDELRHELAIDFFIHDGGVASGWAMQAKPGDKLTVAGPRGSLVVPEDYAYQLYVCDESGMPALRRRLETLSKLAVKPQVSALVSVRDNACQDYLAHLDGFNIEWLAHDEQAVDARLAQMQIPADDYFIWITGEGKVVKNLSRRFEAEQYDPQRVRAAAYWHAK